jgi:hypothetical protein
MAEKPGVYEGAIAWLRGFLGPYHGTGRWFHAFAIFKPHAAVGVPAFGDMRAVENQPGEGPLTVEPLAVTRHRRHERPKLSLRLVP